MLVLVLVPASSQHFQHFRAYRTARWLRIDRASLLEVTVMASDANTNSAGHPDAQQQSAAGADTARSGNSTAAALAVEVPATYAAAAQQTPQDDSGGSAEAPCSSRPASPLNIHSLLNRPFADVMREIVSGFQLKSTAQVAAEQLQYLVFHRDHDREVLTNPALMGHLVQQIRESPGLPSAGSCMFVLAQLARTPAGRAQVRAEGAITHVLRFLSLPDVWCKANAEPALLLLQNITCDKHSRVTLLKAGAIDLLLRLLAANLKALKQQHPRVAAHITGTLVNLVSGDGDSTTAKHMFAKAGGLEVGCKALAIWGRYDHSVATLRLRLLLADLGKLQQYTLTLHQTALDACTSARAQYVEGQTAPAPSQSGAGQIGSARGPGMVAQGLASGAGQLSVPADVSPELLAAAGKGVPLGSLPMPASERITAVVLQHGKNNHDEPAIPEDAS